MQFGRIDGNAYTLDFQYPFSALQAFAVALANVTQRLKWSCFTDMLPKVSFMKWRKTKNHLHITTNKTAYGQHRTFSAAIWETLCYSTAFQIII